MSRFHSVLLLASAVALPVMLDGCAGALIVGGLAAAGGGGYAAAQERGFSGAVSDFQIQTDMQRAFVNAGPGLQEGVITTVYQGRVLLTGRVATPDMKARATQVAGRVSGVRALYDEVEVAPTGSAWDATKDAWITARLRSEMMLDPDVRSGNFTIDTSNGSVYLIGSARTQTELELATRIARYIPGVKRVVSYVELRSGAPVAAGSAPAPLSIKPGPSAPSGAPIEVQKL
jgi:osmotically-inducible protein OsmY